MAEQVSRMDVARMLINRSARLLRLIECDAAEVIIEHERRLVQKALAKFPVHADTVTHVDKQDGIPCGACGGNGTIVLTTGVGHIGTAYDCPHCEGRKTIKP